MRTLHLALFAAAAVTAASATAQVLTPAVAFSVHDEPVDGLGDTFNTNQGLIRTQSTRADRAMHEFDAAAIGGQSITNATLTGQIRVNNAFDNGPRTFDFFVYAGNGLPDLTDYELPGMVVGNGSYHPPNQSSFAYSFDVTSAVQTLLDCGTTFIGLKVIGTSSPNFPNVLDLTTSQLSITAVGAQQTWTDLGFATAGTHGDPRLAGTGTLQPGMPAAVNLCNALENAPGALLIGFSRIDFPLLGATIVPFPDRSPAVAVGPAGMRRLALSYPPPGGGGVSVYFQYFVIDPGAAQGLAVSNALVTLAP